MNPKETDSDFSVGGLDDADEHTRARQIRVMLGEDTDDEWSDAETFDSEIATSACTAPTTDIFEAECTAHTIDTSDLWETGEEPAHEANNTPKKARIHPMCPH
jgi:hypothetical protein